MTMVAAIESAVAGLISWVVGLLLWFPAWVIALVVGLGGALNAWAYFIQKVGPRPLYVQLALIGLIALVYVYARRVALPARPIAAVNAIDGLVLALVIAGALGVYLGVTIAVAFTLPEVPKPTTEMSEVTKAISAAIAAAVTAAVVKVAQDDPDGWVAKQAKSTVVAKYKEAAKANPDLKAALYNDGDEGITGWGRSARKARAEKIAAALMPSGSTPPAPESVV